MTAPVRGSVRRTAVHYGVMFLVTGVILTVVLVRGSNLSPVAELAPLLDSSAAADCLGDNVAVVQSGAFVDLRVPGPPGADTVEGELGPVLIRGLLKTDGSEATFEGECRDESPVEYLVAAGGEGGLLLRPDPTTEPLALPAVEAGALIGAETEPLEGGELVARMFLAVAVVVAAARLVGAAFGRIRQPQVIGEIVAGILLGPSLLGLIAPEVTQYLFPEQVVDVMKIMAQFGLVLFMFLIGLELDQSLLRGSGHTAVFVSHVSILAPLTLGAALAIPLYPLVGSGSFSGFALFMGAAMAITAFPVLARILTDGGLHTTRLGILAITCAAVDDVTAWCVLAIVVGIAQATGAGDALVTIGLAVLFIALMIVAVRPVLRRLEWVHAQRGRLGAHLTAAILVGLLISAWTTEVIGIHAIFGAFLAGAILPRSGDLARELTERLEDLTVLFLLPIFFAVVGLSTSIGLLDQPIHWLIAGGVFAVAVAGKWGGGLVAARMSGERWRESNALGILMNTRGLAEIVILTVGRELGVITPVLFSAMVLMALATTFMTTPLLAVFYPRRIVEDERAAAAPPAPDQTRAAPYRAMVAIGDPATAPELVRVAREIAGGSVRPEIVLARVVELRGDEHLRASLDSIDEAEAEARAALAPMVNKLLLGGFGVDVRVEVGDEPGPVLVRDAERAGADVVVLGMHRSVFGHRAFGGVAGELLSGATCRVAVVVGHTGGGQELVGASDGPILCVDGGIDADAAADVAKRIADVTDAPLEQLALRPGATLPEEARLVVIGYDGSAPADIDREEVIRSSPVPVVVVRAAAAERVLMRAARSSRRRAKV